MHINSLLTLCTLTQCTVWATATSEKKKSRQAAGGDGPLSLWPTLSVCCTHWVRFSRCCSCRWLPLHSTHIFRTLAMLCYWSSSTKSANNLHCSVNTACRVTTNLLSDTTPVSPSCNNDYFTSHGSCQAAAPLRLFENSPRLAADGP